MAKDFVWRQFLLFCHRNGLYYGEELIETCVLYWEETKKVVRHHANKSSAYGKDANGVAADEFDADVVLVGTLERLLRQ